MWRAIKKLLQRRHNFVLTTHVNPDGDGIGAACGLTELLLSYGKKVRFVCDSPIPVKFSFLDFRGTHEVYSPSLDLSETDTLIILDTHKKERIGALSHLIDRKQVVTICIDHHESESPLFTPYAAINPHACSVGAMIYVLCKDCGFELNIEAATGIYTSIFCDTGRFSNAATGRKAHKIADDCIKHGVNPDQMAAKILQHVSLAELKMYANVLQHMETYFDNHVLVQEIRKEDCVDLGDGVEVEEVDLDPFLDLNKQIENVDCVLLLREGKDGVRVSLRSNTDIDIGEIMEALGGGGHRKAAGLTWKGSMEEVKFKILARLEKLLDGKLIEERNRG